MKTKQLCEGYKYSLKTALEHTRNEFAKLDGCKPEDVKPFHPSQHEIEFDQKELF